MNKDNGNNISDDNGEIQHDLESVEQQVFEKEDKPGNKILLYVKNMKSHKGFLQVPKNNF